MTKRPARPHHDPRFALHQRQPRADKLDARQRQLCRNDPGFREALRSRVESPERFSAFMGGAAYYIDVKRPCAKCGSGKRRTRDRSCYACHLRRSGENFERMKAGLAPVIQRNAEGHLDRLQRTREEGAGECMERTFDGLVARRWPLGRLEVTFPDGYHEPDLRALNYQGMRQAIREFPQLVAALQWAGWVVPG